VLWHFFLEEKRRDIMVGTRSNYIGYRNFIILKIGFFSRPKRSETTRPSILFFGPPFIIFLSISNIFFDRFKFLTYSVAE